MEMTRKVEKKSDPLLAPPPVVSTNCSSFKSLYRTCRSNFSCSNLSSRRYLPINPSSRKTSSSQLLEHELAKLDELLDIEAKNIVDGVNNKMEPDKIENVAAGNRRKACEWKGMLRLVDGGYLFDHGGNLCMQVSAPALIPIEIGSSFSQVMNRMASMGKENLMKWLVKSMPMCDLSKNSSEKVDFRNVTTMCSEEGFLEAILIEGVEKLEILALEGLKVKERGKLKVKKEKANKKVEFDVGDGFIEVMLIQMRDPNKGYEDIGKTMIGLIEGRLGERHETSFWFRGIHVAGTRGGKNESGYLWSISMRNLSEGSCRAESDMIVMNDDIVFVS